MGIIQAQQKVERNDPEWVRRSWRRLSFVFAGNLIFQPEVNSQNVILLHLGNQFPVVVSEFKTLSFFVHDWTQIREFPIDAWVALDWRNYIIQIRFTIYFFAPNGFFLLIDELNDIATAFQFEDYLEKFAGRSWIFSFLVFYCSIKDLLTLKKFIYSPTSITILGFIFCNSFWEFDAIINRLLAAWFMQVLSSTYQISLESSQALSFLKASFRNRTQFELSILWRTTSEIVLTCRSSI